MLREVKDGEVHGVYLRGGDLELVNGYCQYEPESDFVVMSYQLQCFRLRYQPPQSPAKTRQPTRS